MTLEEAKRLTDLFIDDELPAELASEFKHCMFEHSELRDEVSSLKQTRDWMTDAFANDKVTESERLRIFSRILAESGALARMETRESAGYQLHLPIR